MTMQEKLELAIQDTKDVLDDLSIEYGPVVDVTINFRAQSRWGRCTYRRITGDYVIEVSSRLLADGVEWEALLNTLIHEFLHAHRDRMCHTGEWKRCANLVNKEYPCYNIKRCTSAAENGIEESPSRISSVKYIATCNICGAYHEYKRKSKVVQLLLDRPYGSCTCGRCGGESFTVEEL